MDDLVLVRVGETFANFLKIFRQFCFFLVEIVVDGVPQGAFVAQFHLYEQVVEFFDFFGFLEDYRTIVVGAVSFLFVVVFVKFVASAEVPVLVEFFDLGTYGLETKG